jgi:hypothetical protein
VLDAGALEHPADPVAAPSVSQGRQAPSAGADAQAQQSITGAGFAHARQAPAALAAIRVAVAAGAEPALPAHQHGRPPPEARPAGPAPLRRGRRKPLRGPRRARRQTVGRHRGGRWLGPPPSIGGGPPARGFPAGRRPAGRDAIGPASCFL